MIARLRFLGGVAAVALFASGAHAAQPVALTAPAATPAAAVVDGPVAGYGNRLPMSVVLKSIVPAGFTVHVERDIDQAQLVTWQGGDSWHHSLETALSALDLVVAYSADHVEISRIKMPEPPAPPPLALAAWERTQVWNADPNGQDLRDVALAWGRQAGIVPVIKGDYSYPVEAPLHFKGNFRDAMNYLVQAFSTASPPPLIHQWADADQGNYAVQIILGN